MPTVVTVITGIVLIVAALFLIAAVLMQSAKNSRMSGVVSGGGAETFFGKYKGKTVDKTLNRLTIIVAIFFVVVVLALYIIQPGKGKIDYGDAASHLDDAQNAVTTVVTEGTETPDTGATTAE